MDQVLTTYDKLNEYKKDYAAVLEQLDLLRQRVKVRADMSRQPAHEFSSIRHNDKLFCYSVYHSYSHAHCIVYLMLPATEYFEAIAYDRVNNCYYLFSDHFFKRYAERLFIKNKTHEQIMIHYLEHNPILVIKKYNRRKVSAKPQHLTGTVKTGLVYGLVVHPYPVINLDTLIAHGTLGKKKRMSISRAKKKMEKIERG